MKLSVLERFTLLSMLPEKGSFTNLKLLRKAKESLSFDDKENKALNFRSIMVKDEERTAWNIYEGSLNAQKEIQKRLEVLQADDKTSDPSTIADLKEQLAEIEANLPELKKIENKDFKFGEVVTNMIAKQLKEMDDKEELTDQHETIYEKFVVGDKKPPMEVVH